MTSRDGPASNRPAVGETESDRRDSGSDLLQQAKETARKASGASTEELESLSPDEVQQRLHDLRVQRIELELENRELLQSRDRLQAARNRYFNHYDQAPVAYLTVSREEVILEANRLAAILLGVPQDDLVGQPLSRFIFAEDREIYRRLRCQFCELDPQDDPPSSAPAAPPEPAPDVAGSLSSPGVEFRLVTDDGLAFWARLDASAAWDDDDDDGPICLLTFRDISSARRARKESRVKDELLRTVGRIARVGGWEYDVATRHITWTDEVYRIYGVDPATYDPSDVEQDISFYGPNDQASIAEAFRRAVEKGEPYDLELEFCNTQGEQRWVRTIGRPEQRDGETVRVFGFIMDITDSKRNERALRQSEAFLTAVFESIQDGISVLSTDLTIRHVNSVMESWYGRSRPLAGKKCYRVYQARETPCDPCPTLRCIDSGQVEQEIVPGVPDSDSAVQWLELFSYPIKDGDTGQVTGVVEFVRDITARKQAEAGLKSTLAELSAIHENAPVIMMLVDRERRVQKVNGAAAAFARRTADEMTGLVGGEALRCLNALDDPRGCGYGPHCDECLVRRAVLDTFADRKRRDHVETWLPFQINGEATECCLEVSTAYLQLTEGERVLVCVQDITERKRAEEALQESELRFRRVYEHIRVGIAQVSLEGVIERANQAYCHMLGYSEEELRGKHLSDITHPEVLEDNMRQQRRLAEGETDHYRMEERFIHRDGHTVHGILDANLIRDPVGNPRYILGSVLDITARKQAEAERERLLRQVEEQARRVQGILDTVPEGVVLLSTDGQILQANPVAEGDLEVLTRGEVGDVITHLGDRPLEEFLTSPPDGPWHEVCVGDSTFEIIARPMDLALSPSDTGDPPDHWVLVIDDVTRQREAQAQLRHQERLVTVGQLAAGIAHDFNNILGSIMLHAELGLHTPDLSPRVRERFEIVQAEAHSAADLVRQILDFGRRAPISRGPLDLRLLLKEQVRLLKRTLPEHIQITLSSADDACTVHADPARVQQVVTNLALNSRDAMPEGGSLEITLRRLAPGEPLRCVTCGPLTEGRWVELSVTDSGSGIPPDALPHVFEPFFTTRAPLGHGLGLAQVYGIVKQHEGHIDVETEEGVGTTFRLYWPAIPPEPGEPEEDPGAPQGHGETILVVEDDRSLRAALADVLNSLGYNVLTASDGHQTLELLETGTESVALILSDWVMPGMSGGRLAKEMAAAFPEIPVLVLTGHTVTEKMRALVPGNVAGWITKPPDLTELAASVGRVLAGIPRHG